MVDSINKLLDRQDDLVRKARDRAGVLAHGLKTPLTILGGDVRRIEQAGLHDVAAGMQEQLGLIRTLVEREVARARTSGASVGCGAYTQVDETVARLLRLMRHMPRGERLLWTTSIPAGLALDMDPHDFGEVMGNLIDNARKWATAKVAILCRKSRGQGANHRRRRRSRFLRRRRPAGAGAAGRVRSELERAGPRDCGGYPLGIWDEPRDRRQRSVPDPVRDAALPRIVCSRETGSSTACGTDVRYMIGSSLRSGSGISQLIQQETESTDAGWRRFENSCSFLCPEKRLQMVRDPEPIVLWAVSDVCQRVTDELA